MSRYVAIDVDGEVRTHARSEEGNYMTLCGLDGGISGSDQREVGLMIGARIDCQQCHQIFTAARKLRARDFVSALTSQERQP